MDDIFAANPRNMWNFRQNHPELVIRDCRKYGFTETEIRIVRQSLLVRGINKWLKVRRDLIAYKIQVRGEIKRLQRIMPILKSEMNELYCTKSMVLAGERPIDDLEAYYRKRVVYQSAKERLKLLNDVRGTLKQLCMTDRWQVWEGKTLKDMNSLKASEKLHAKKWRKENDPR